MRSDTPVNDFATVEFRSTLTNAVGGTTTGGYLVLDQRATGGAGGK